jgi:anthranilate phosphoribosyltransferase
MSTSAATTDSLAILAAFGGWPEVFASLTGRRDLPPEIVGAAVSEILQGAATPAQVAGFLIGLRSKGESVAELGAALASMLAVCVSVPLSDATRERAICTCGTGGDRSNSINISTTAMFVVAGAGGVICKHGGRAASSQAGSADVLEALGVVLELSPVSVARCVEEVGVGFCLAPRFHPAMRHAAPVRRELGVASMFNFLGPIANPGRVQRQLVGVADPAMAPKMAAVLAASGTKSAVFVHGHDGLDELTTTTTSSVWTLDETGAITESVFDPASLGIERATAADLLGGTAANNAIALTRVLDGEAGPHRDIVVLNAAAGLVAAGIATDVADGVGHAQASIDDGSARRILDGLVALTQELREPSA